MSELKCKECGSSDIVQDGTQSPCQACGTKFSPENINQDEVEATNNQTPQQYNGTTQQYMVLNSRIIQSAASTCKKKKYGHFKDIINNTCRIWISIYRIYKKMAGCSSNIYCIVSIVFITMFHMVFIHVIGHICMYYCYKQRSSTT